MKRFFVIEDYTECSIWDDLIISAMLKLPSKPKDWGRKDNTLPEGDWQLGHGMHQHGTDGAYLKAGIPKPFFEQLPAMFCVEESGEIRCELKVMTAEKAVEFIRGHLE